MGLDVTYWVGANTRDAEGEPMQLQDPRCSWIQVSIGKD